jgi:riboflavin kinase/FMN adenylyltransferase
MQVFRSLDEIAGQSERSVATVGSFDGIHLAHQELLRRVRELAEKERAASVAITFDPHPVSVLAPEKAPRLLTPTPVKLELIERSGVDRLLILPFTQEFSRWPPEKFVKEVLVKTLRVASVVVGENFRFGHKQAGTPQVLTELGRRWNFHTEILPRIQFRKMNVSSSQVRCLLEAGEVSVAGRLLGRPFSIHGPIEAGLGIGRSQTVPTLNLAPYPGLMPGRGVYVTWARVAFEDEGQTKAPRLSQSLRSVTNVGHRPTFGERELGVETHLLDPLEGPPPSLLEVSFLHRLRDERKFDSAEQLKTQILRDIRRAERYFRLLNRSRISFATSL